MWDIFHPQNVGYISSFNIAKRISTTADSGQFTLQWVGSSSCAKWNEKLSPNTLVVSIDLVCFDIFRIVF